MSIYLLSILLVIASQIAYQLAQKSVPPGTHPMIVLTIVYLAAAALCPIIAVLMDRPLTTKDWSEALTWPTALLALSVVGIEVGYLLAFRNGWKLGTTFAFAGTTTIVILAAVGTLWWREPLSARQAVGVALAIVGGLLITNGA